MARSSKKDEDAIPLSEFDRRNYTDRGFYIICQFQDEKRRRDRDEALAFVRICPDYVCLLTEDNRLIHRVTFTRTTLHLFLHLYDLIRTWATKEFFIMGYPIEPDDLMDGIDCFGQMGKTCNRLINKGSDVPAYVGCPRASVSFKYMHPKAWYTFYLEDPDEPGTYRRVDKPEPPSDAYDAEAWEDAYTTGLAEITKIGREYCGCPLVNLRRTRAFFRKHLPKVLSVEDGEWRIAPDLMGDPSLQPTSKDDYYAFLDEKPVGMFPSSERPEPTLPGDDEDDDEDEDEAPRRKRDLSRFTWLLEG